MLTSIESLWCKVVCIVEPQEQAATLDLVDSIDDLVVLECLLGVSKSAFPDNIRHPQSKHYLITTPFR